MPNKSSWESTSDALKDAIELENHVYNEIIRIHRIADKTCKDVHVSLPFVNFLLANIYITNHVFTF